MDWAHVSALQNLQSWKMSNVGQWLWLSWKSGCFRLQRYGVRIQSSAKIYIDHLLSTVNEKTKMKKKWPGMSHFYKKMSKRWYNIWWPSISFHLTNLHERYPAVHGICTTPLSGWPESKASTLTPWPPPRAIWIMIFAISLLQCSYLVI